MFKIQCLKCSGISLSARPSWDGSSYLFFYLSGCLLQQAAHYRISQRMNVKNILYSLFFFS